MSRTTRNRGYHSWMQDDARIRWQNREIAINAEWIRRRTAARSAHPDWRHYLDKHITDDPIGKVNEQFDRWARDGRDGMTASTANTGFKTDAKKTLRRANKNFCRSVLSGDDYENIPLPNRILGKSHKWDWW